MGGGVAQSQLRDSRRRCPRDEGNRLLLRRGRRRLRLLAPVRARAALCPSRAFDPRRAGAARPLARHVASDLAASARTPAGVGADHRRSGRMYRHRLGLFIGIGLLLVPISLFVALLQTAVLKLVECRGDRERRSGRGSPRAPGRRLRDGADPARDRARPGCDGARARRDRCGRPVGALRAYRLAARSACRCLARSSSRP